MIDEPMIFHISCAVDHKCLTSDNTSILLSKYELGIL